MPVATKLPSPAKAVPGPPRTILGPGGNRVRVLEETKRRMEVSQSQKKKKAAQPEPRKDPPPPARAEFKDNCSADGSCSSSDTCSTCSGSSSRSIPKRNGKGTVKAAGAPPKLEGAVNRCDWITPNSDPLYMSFHDEEWGVPVYDDRKLFELLVFSIALAEFSWAEILHMRDIFRKLFDNFDISSISQFTERKLLSLKVNGKLLLSEPKLRAVVENAKQLLKLQQEFGSFSNYCWRFVNHKPLQNGFRYARQVPVKSPKAELMSKDLMQRGFRCVGPIVVYSFMQVAGIVNDHLITCFRHQECNANVQKGIDSKTEQQITRALEDSHLAHE